MAVFAHEIGDMRACTGKPAELGGIPHELGTTGYGVATEMSRQVIYRAMLLRKGAINVAREAFERRDKISV